MYSPVDPKANFSRLEEAVLAYWKERGVFQKSLEKNKDKSEFVFYDGPPFATGMPHFGHFVPSTVKDIIPRYKTMQGYFVKRRFGWDCHGLPVEYEAERELGISGAHEIERYGVAAFNEYCRSIVMRYTEQWRLVIERLGRWVDFDNDYKTMDMDYMQSIWWVFSELWKKGLIYQGYYILPYSAALATPLSNFEVNLGGYKEVHDSAITVRFALRAEAKTYFLAWTTTPWTLPSNMGLGVNAGIAYVRVLDKASGDSYILAEERLSHYYKDASEYSIEKKLTGDELAGMRYEPLFPYFESIAEQGGFTVHSADFVSADEGTGIVHLAGGFGEDDYNVVCKKQGLPVICPIDDECKFTDEVPDYRGMFVKDADKPIIARLKSEGKLVRREQYLHNYPFCYRSKTPLIYRAVQSWFVNLGKIKERLIAANKRINWLPSHLQEGRFGHWLENARDWAISRNRFWGNPIPVWMSEDGKHVEVIGSVAELEEKSGTKLEDIHKHFIDEITWTAPDGKQRMKRIPQVLDCWFESGAMPYAQNYYPFQNKEGFEESFPADFITEGLDQTRGWFYTLSVLGAALFDSPAFKNVIVNGLVLAEDGRKMSKSERNFTDPMEVMHKFGADALRLFLINSSVLKAEDLKYSDEHVREEMKNYILPLWSAYSFFVTYANIDGIHPSENNEVKPNNPLDQWILSELMALIEKTTQCFDAYDIFHALGALQEFLDLLNNWYIRRSRRRFWKSSNDIDKQQGYQTLYTVLCVFIKLTAPITPFISESIYKNLRVKDSPESVHLCDFPRYEEGGDIARNLELEYKMRTVRNAVTLGRGIRSLYEIKNRQPLSAVYFFTRVEKERNALREMEEIIKEELNVKEVIFRQNEEDLLSYSAKPQYRVLGKQLGKAMKQAAKAIEELSSEQIKALLEGSEISITIEAADGEAAAEDKALTLTTENVLVERTARNNLKVLNENSLTVALDTDLTQELEQEGQVRDVVRALQNMRKDIGLEVTDRISIHFCELSDSLRAAIERFESYVSGETLATTVHYQDHVTEDARSMSVGAQTISVVITKLDTTT